MNRNIVIFGATGGIGTSCCELLDECEDLNLSLVGRDIHKLKALSDRLTYKHQYYALDFDRGEMIEEIILKIIKGSGKIDGVIFAAGKEGVRPIRVMSLDFFNDVFNVNCSSFLQICRYMSSKRFSNDGASIVAISSLTSVSLSNCEGAYGISKAALNTAVKQASMELVNRKIRVNAILPASTQTNMMDKVMERIPDFMETLPEFQPLGMIEPKQVAYLADFLLSEKSKYITGSCIPISAGRRFF